MIGADYWSPYCRERPFLRKVVSTSTRPFVSVTLPSTLSTTWINIWRRLRSNTCQSSTEKGLNLACY